MLPHLFIFHKCFQLQFQFWILEENDINLPSNSQRPKHSISYRHCFPIAPIPKSDGGVDIGRLTYLVTKRAINVLKHRVRISRVPVKVAIFWDWKSAAVHLKIKWGNCAKLIVQKVSLSLLRRVYRRRFIEVESYDSQRLVLTVNSLKGKTYFIVLKSSTLV